MENKMQFYEWRTMLDEAVKRNPALKKLSPFALLEEEYKNIRAHKFKSDTTQQRRLLRLSAESLWQLSDRPYYQIHPKIADKLCKINLDKIPARYIEIPEGGNVISLRFSEELPLHFVDKNKVNECHKIPVATKEEFLRTRSVLFCHLNKEQIDRWQDELPAKVDEFFGVSQFLLILDEGFRTIEDNVERTLCNSVLITVKDNEQTIPEAIHESLSENPIFGHPDMIEKVTNLFKIIISVGFLKNAPEDNLIAPDVLNRDQKAYELAVKNNDIDRINTILARAKRLGHNGWNVGTNEIFVGENAIDTQTRSDNPRKELAYSHIRSGHPHIVRFGKGKEKIKIKWYRSIRVRNDLPFKD